MGRKHRRLLQAPAAGFAYFSRPSDLANPLKMIFSGHQVNQLRHLDREMKADGLTRAAAGTASSYSVLTLTVMTPAGIAK